MDAHTIEDTLLHVVVQYVQYCIESVRILPCNTAGGYLPLLNTSFSKLFHPMRSILIFRSIIFDRRPRRHLHLLRLHLGLLGFLLGLRLAVHLLLL